jgi:tRNA(fMet)-specific endonuclease VapC
MTIWILDTDHITLFQNNHPLVTQKVNQVSPEYLSVTIISVEEQMRGWLNMINQFSDERVRIPYQRLKSAVSFFCSINICEFDQNAYNCYTDLVQQRVRIGTKDLSIASIALCQNAILVTRNRRDFERVPGLILADWSV